MARPHSVGIWASTRPLAWLMIIGFVMIDPALAQPSRVGTGEVIAIRELQLRPGVDTTEFERFVIERYNPEWQGAVPGMKGYIAKGDRGAQKSGYALVLIFDSEKTRNAIYPKEGGGASERFMPFLEGPFRLNEELNKYIEPATLSVYTDYVVLR